MRANRLQLLLGIEGLALLRMWLAGGEADAEARIGDVARLVKARSEFRPADFSEFPASGASEFYDVLAATYDDRPNPIFALEEGAVRGILDEWGPATVLDAACGTGRHAEYLLGRGHRVIAVDDASEMLNRARAKLPTADLRRGDLEALPLEDESVDAAVCALALTHLPDIAQSMHELARVVRPGGLVVLSDVHPQFISLGGAAFEVREGARRRFLRNHFHPHCSYLSAFANSGLTLRSCQEPAFDQEAVESLRPPQLRREAVSQAFLGLPAVLIWELEKTADTRSATAGSE